MLKLEMKPPAVADRSGDRWSLRLEPFLGVAKLQLGPREPVALLAAAIGIPLPPIGRVAAGPGAEIAWLGPTEWLVLGAPAEVGALLAQADAAMAGRAFIAVDVSHGRAAFRLAGARAPDRLAAVASANLTPRTFRPGQCLRTALGDTVMFIARLADDRDAPDYRVIIDQTMAGYAARMIEEPGR